MWTSPTTTRRALRDDQRDDPRVDPKAVDVVPRRSAASPVWRFAPLVPAIGLTALFALRWSNGWLLLLDAAPGPRTAAWSGPDLPVGIGLRAVVGAVAALDPALVGWAVPAGAVVASYAGGYRLAQRWRGPHGNRITPVAAIVGGCVAATNPFVAARLYTGQIGVLWGYAALWWLAAAVLGAVDRKDRRSWLAPGVWLALAATATIHLAVIGMIPILIGGAVHSRRIGRREAALRAAGSVVLGAGLTAAWLVPMLVARSGSLGDAGGDRAARAFASGGSMTTLWVRALGGAAFWRPLPAGTLTVFGVLVAAAWIATVLAWRHGSGHSRDTRHVLVGCAVVACAVVVVGHGPLAAAWSWSVAHLWPAGLLREPGKLLMLTLLAPTAGAAVAAQRLLDRNRRLGVAVVLATVVVCIVAWGGLTGRLTPSSYPTAWIEARAAADVDACSIAVLGDGAYVNPGFTGGRVVAHPARGFLGPRSVVSNDAQMPGLRPREPRSAAERWSATVNDRYLRHDGPAPVASAAAAATIGWVFVDRPVDRPELVADLRSGGFEPAYESDRADMWRVPGGCA